ncbi:MAG: alginate export family protein [Nitrospiraceae bacterium]|nr:alginate export family protein [Nitrospiraceae bacterium]
MKKLLAILLGALFVFSFAASAFAIHAEIPSETQAVVAKGATQITIDGELRTRGWYEKNDIVGGKSVGTGSGAWYDERIRLSVDAKVSPNVQGFVQLESGSGQSDIYTWGNFNSKPTGVSVLQAWILYRGTGLFGFNSGLKIGHMPLALGEKQFFDHTKFGDDAIVFFMDPTKEMHIGLLAVKFAEGNKKVNGDDLDGYVGLMTYKLDAKNTVGINYTYLNQSMNRFSHQDLGLHANGNVSGLGYRTELDIQFGKLSDTVKAKGWAFLLGLNYAMDPANIRATFGYGSGDNGSDKTKNKAFIPYVDATTTADQHYTLVYEYQVATTSGSRFTGLANTTYYNLGLDYKVSPEVKASVDGYIIRASKTAAGVSKDAGWELDGKVAYNVAKNLVYQVDAGYLKTGKFYGDAKKGITVLRHMLTLSF